MAAPRRVSRAGAVIGLRELDRVAAAAKAAGREPPPVAEWGDAMSRPVARQWLDWAAKQPAVVKAMQNPNHPEFAMANDVIRPLLHHFAFHHPATGDGAPAPWTEPLSPALAAFATGARENFDLAELGPHEAAALHAFAGARSDLAAAANDEAHPHAAAVLEALGAAEARAGEAPTEPQPGEQQAAATAAASATTAATRAEIAALLHDPEFTKVYYDKREPGHQQAVDRMLQLHKGLIAPVKIVPSLPAPAAAAPAAAVARLDEIAAQLRAYNLSAPDKARLAEEAHELASGLPPGTPRTSSVSGRILPQNERPVAVVGSGRVASPRAVALTEMLKPGGSLGGMSRRAAIDELGAILGGAPPAATDAAPAVADSQAA